MCAGVCAHTCVCLGVFGWGASLPAEPRHGTCYLFLILLARCGFPAVTGLRVETGTNEQLHPACLPGIMGLQADRASVFALFLHSHLVIPSLPCVRLISAFRLLPFRGSIILLSFFFPLDTNPFSIFNSPHSYHVLFFYYLILSFDFVAASHTQDMAVVNC